MTLEGANMTLSCNRENARNLNLWSKIRENTTRKQNNQGFEIISKFKIPAIFEHQNSKLIQILRHFCVSK